MDIPCIDRDDFSSSSDSREPDTDIEPSEVVPLNSNTAVSEASLDHSSPARDRILVEDEPGMDELFFKKSNGFSHFTTFGKR
jgi:hypothetical protein